MDDLITRVAGAAQIEPGVARQAVSQILAFLKAEASPADVDAAFAKMPGAAALAAEADAAGAPSGSGLMGMLGGMMGGGLMRLAGKLSSLGLGMGEMRSVGETIFAYAREQGAEAEMTRLAAGVPGLSQFM